MSGAAGISSVSNDTKMNCFARAATDASIKLIVPAPSVAANESPALAVVIAVTVEITVSAPAHAASSESRSLRSQTAIAHPIARSAPTLSGADVARTGARTD